MPSAQGPKGLLPVWPWPAKKFKVLRLFTSYTAGRSNLSSVSTAQD